MVAAPPNSTAKQEEVKSEDRTPELTAAEPAEDISEQNEIQLEESILEPTAVAPAEDISEQNEIQSENPTSNPTPTSPAPLVLQRNPFGDKISKASLKWKFIVQSLNLKKHNRPSNHVMENMMKLTGLEDVKQLFLDIWGRCIVCVLQGISDSKDWYNIVFQ
jgi:hypothetical protein